MDIYQCQHCDKSFQSKKSLASHARWHQSETQLKHKFQLKCSCVECHKELSVQNLGSHIKSKHTLTVYSYCEFCNIPLYTKRRFCNRSCAAKHNNKIRSMSGWKHSIETKKKISIKTKLYCEQNRQPVYTKISQCVMCLKWFEGRKKTCSNYCRRHLASKNSAENPNVGGFKHKSQLKTYRSIYKGYYMDSGAERYFAILLDSVGVKWIKNDIDWKKFYRYTDSKGRKRKYYPDFYLPQLNIWVEIKGKRYMKDIDLKIASTPIPTILVMNTDIKNYAEQILEQPTEIESVS